MKRDLREIYLAPAAFGEEAIDVFAEKYQAKHHKAVECLTKDREALLAFFNFPAEHWDHLRTTNPSKAYTLMLSGVGSQRSTPGIYKKMPIDPVKDFTHISLIASGQRGH